MNQNLENAAINDKSKTAFKVLVVISLCHLINDMTQSMLPAIYPMLANSFTLNFGQIGLISLVYQMTGSVFQPLVGLYTDRYPKTYSLAFGMALTLAGLLFLSQAGSFSSILLSAALVGLGSSVFHPESSRVARMASGGRHGMAQSLFQVGGNFGSSLGPLLAAFWVLPHGQMAVGWVSIAPLLGIALLIQVGQWYRRNKKSKSHSLSAQAVHDLVLSRKTVMTSVGILLLLIFSKYFYLTSLTSYYTFYLISKFHVSVQDAQIYLFIFLAAVAAGTIIGGPIGDRIGRKYVIWGSILGVLPFTLILPYANLLWTAVLTVPIGVILASAFSAIVVYGQELIPGKVGMIAGLFFGFAFGMAGIGAGVLGYLADYTSIETVYRICAFLPLIGLVAAFLPNLDHRKRLKPVTLG